MSASPHHRSQERERKSSRKQPLHHPSVHSRNTKDYHETMSQYTTGLKMKEKEYFPHHQNPPYFDSMSATLDDILESSNKDTVKKKRRSTDSHFSASSNDGDWNITEGATGGGASFTSPRKSTNSLLQRVASIKSMLSVSSFANLADPVNNVEGQPSLSSAQASSHSSLNASQRSQLYSPPSSFFSLRASSGTGQQPPAQVQLPYGPGVPPAMDPNSATGATQVPRYVSPTLATPQQQLHPMTPSGRQKERLKTVNAGLILAFNIGTDPPNIHKPNPHAKLQAWFDPTSTSRAKARDIVAQRLEEQYTKWSTRSKLKIKKTVDPTGEDVRILCQRLRREARGERVLLHYNGHGVPRATARNGELWVFDVKHTQYIPLNARELRAWVSKPSLIVLDCHGAGALLPFLTEEHPIGTRGGGLIGPGAGLGGVDILSSVQENPGNGGVGGFMPPGMHRNMGHGHPLNMTGGVLPGLNPGMGGGVGMDRNMARGTNTHNGEDMNSMGGNNLNMRGGNNNRMNLNPVNVVDPNIIRMTGNNVNPNLNFVQNTGVVAGAFGGNLAPLPGRNAATTMSTNPNPTGPNNQAIANANIVKVPQEEVDPDAAYAAKAIGNVIVLCPVSANEDLPLNPELPADLFTSCQTTPVQTAMSWFIYQNPLSCPPGLNLEYVDGFTLNVDFIPGKSSDRKTPLGEINWIFTAVTDTIAWNVLSPQLFQVLFRQDLFVASMFRNFLLADRIFRGLNCTPCAYPAIPDTSQHPLWQSWDLVMETFLSQLARDGHLGENNEENKQREASANESAKGLSQSSGSENSSDPRRNARENVGPGPAPLNLPSLDPGMVPKTNASDPIQAGNRVSQASSVNNSSSTYSTSAPFFTEQLTAFDIWLDFAANKVKEGGIVVPPGKRNKTENSSSSQEIEAPEQLPIVLQVLLSPSLRIQALILLRRFVYLGPSAVKLAIAVGILPYVVKLLESPIDEYKYILIGIWYKMLEFDPFSKKELLTKNSLSHFIHHLRWGLEIKQDVSSSDGSHFICTETNTLNAGREIAARQRTMAAVILTSLCDDYPEGQKRCRDADLSGLCSTILRCIEDQSKFSNSKESDSILTEYFPSEYRFWLCICLGVFFKNNIPAQNDAFQRGIYQQLFERLNDDSSDVRTSACFALDMLYGFSDRLVDSMPFSSDRYVSMTDLAPPQQHQLLQIPNINIPSLNQPISLQAPPLNLSSQSRQQCQQNLEQQQQPGLVPMHEHVRSQSSIGYVNAARSTLPQSFSLQQVQSAHQESQLSYKKSVYEDKNRLHRDLELMDKLQETSRDGCPTVRFEALLVLGKAVQRYLHAFVALADKIESKNEEAVKERNDRFPALSRDQKETNAVPLPIEFDEKSELILCKIWELFCYLDSKDPHPMVSKLAASIRTQVYCSMSTFHQKQEQTRRRIIDRTHSVADMSSVSESNKSSSKQLNQLRVSSSASNISRGSKNTQENSNINMRNEEFTIIESSPSQPTGPISPFPNRRRSAGDRGLKMELIPEFSKSTPVSEVKSPTPEEDCYQVQYPLPKSEFYAWKKTLFQAQEGPQSSNDIICDPLSKEGAIRIYRSQRNEDIDKEGKILTAQFSVLAPKSKRDDGPYDSYRFQNADRLEEEEEDEEDRKKYALKFEEKKLLFDKSSAMTSTLRFHSYEPVLLACDDSDGISIWNTEKDIQVNRFENTNSNGTRMTSLSWINERNNSKLLTGCDDGSIRVWDGLIEGNGAISSKEPELRAAFYTSNKMLPKPPNKGAGLVMEWQQLNGRLLTGGSSDKIQCWDLEAQKCMGVMENQVDDCLTTMTTTWDCLSLGDVEYSPLAGGSSGIGPDIIVAGYGNGKLKVFDLRTQQQGSVNNLGSTGSLFTNGRQLETEHSSWIINTSFNHYNASRYEVVSGDLNGFIKHWDLRSSRSLRTKYIRHQMTAFSCHSKIPIFATGSNSSFVNIFTPFGERLQCISKHKTVDKSQQRIGQISALTFHPTKPLLAFGSIDKSASRKIKSSISLYGPIAKFDFR